MLQQLQAQDLHQQLIALQPNNTIMTKIYSTPTCVYCKTLKGYLKKNGIEFEDIDISKDEKQLQKMIKDSGQMTVPVVDIDGEITVGFDKEKIDRLLKIGQ
jgi:glutaredoxin-like YruB-family protein